MKQVRRRTRFISMFGKWMQRWFIFWWRFEASTSNIEHRSIMRFGYIDWNIFFLKIHIFFPFFNSPYIIWHIQRQTDLISFVHVPIVSHDNHEVNALSSAATHCKTVQKFNQKTILWIAKHSFGAHDSIGFHIYSEREA